MTPGSDVLLRNRYGNLVEPRTPSQCCVTSAIQDKDVVFSTGPAGTGKTFLSVAIALSHLKDDQVDRIILARPAVEAGENLGFLPGTLQDKLDPYLMPFYDVLSELLTPKAQEAYRKKGQIEIAPLAYLRGRTLKNAFIILDEAQNCTYSQLKMMLTRLGPKSKVIITGDPSQTDLPHRSKSALRSHFEILSQIEDIAFVVSDPSEVVRHQLVQDIIEAYDYYERPEDKE